MLRDMRAPVEGRVCTGRKLEHLRRPCFKGHPSAPAEGGFGGQCSPHLCLASMGSREMLALCCPPTDSPGQGRGGPREGGQHWGLSTAAPPKEEPQPPS